MKEYASEAEALKTSTGFVNDGRLVGYFGIGPANYLVGNHGYTWWQASCWGYVLEKPRP